MKKAIALLISAALGITMLNGCSNKENGTVQNYNPFRSNEKVTIQFYQHKREAVPTYNKLIKEFEKENPNIEVIQTSYPKSLDDIRMGAAKNDLPDVIGGVEDGTYADLAKIGVFIDMTNAPELQRVEPAYVQMLKDVARLERVYAIPYVANAYGVIYNKKLFKELGLTIPKTWHEFIITAQKVKQAGKIPFYFTFKEDWTILHPFNALAVNFQGDHFLADRRIGKTTFKDRYREPAYRLLKLIEYGHSENFNKDYEAGNKAFAQGESVMYLQGNWAIPAIKKVNPNIELGMFPFPATNDPAKNKVLSGVDVYLALSKLSKHPVEARKFIDFLLEKQNVNLYITEQNAYSAIKGIVQENPVLKELKPSFEQGKLAGFPNNYMPTSIVLERQVQQLVKDKNIDAFLNNLDAQWNNAQMRR